MTRKAERRSRRKGGVLEIASGGSDKDNITAAAHIPAPRREAGVCWRCGASFALTTGEILRRCAELAKREAS